MKKLLIIVLLGLSVMLTGCDITCGPGEELDPDTNTCVEESVCSDGYEWIEEFQACEYVADTPNCMPGTVLDTLTNTCVEEDTGDGCFAKGFDYNINELTYNLIWSDEFDGTALDTTYWTYEVNGNGGGNNELQYYTRDNTLVSDGTLKIIAKLEDYDGHDYTSSRIVTRNKFDFKYGKVEVRAILPGGRGTWPAVWMMPTNSVYGGWPNSGEIDIMEYVGYDHGKIFGSIHTEAFNHKIHTQKGGVYYGIDDMDTTFHTYSIEWLPDQIRYYVDGDLYYTFNPNSYASCPDSEEWPFNKDFYLIMNVAIGGDWGGVQGVDDSIFPVQMEVDYIRVYQADEINALDD